MEGGAGNEKESKFDSNGFQCQGILQGVSYSEGAFYRLLRDGGGPRITKTGIRTIIDCLAYIFGRMCIA